MLKDDDLLSEIEADFENAIELPERQRVMLRYAIKLTCDPKSIVKSDVESLRDVGFTDIDILHIVEVTAYYAYVNRIADGLGVELEM